MTIKLACLQLKAFDIRESDLALQNALQMIDQAAENNVDLVVLPECTFPGYILGLNDNVEEQIGKTPDGVDAFQKKAQKHGLHLVVGLAEMYKGKIRNTAVLISPKGEIIGRVAKSFLWHFDSNWFVSGENFEVFETGIGRIGIIICADGRQPEIARILTLKGAELIVDLTNLVTSGFHSDKLSNPQCEYMLSTRALENKVWLVVANKVGLEAKSVVYCGKSCVIAPDGSIVRIASSYKQEIVYGEIDLNISKLKQINDMFNVVSDRKPGTYNILGEDYSNLPLKKYLNEKIIPEEKVFYSGVVQLDKHLTIEEFIETAGEFAHTMTMQYTKLLVFPDLPCLEKPDKERYLVENQRKIAMENEIYIISCGTQVDKGNIYKGAYLFWPDGSHQFYRKVHLDNSEVGKYKSGNKMEVWETPLGRIGIMLNYEGFLPEVARSLTLMGADVIAWPVNFKKNHQELIARTRAQCHQPYM